MKVFIRYTSEGSEYWDTEGKRIVFERINQETKEDIKLPESFIEEDTKEVIEDITEELFSEPIDFSKMSLKELREYAENNDIKIPSKLTKKSDISEFLYGKL